MKDMTSPAFVMGEYENEAVAYLRDGQSLVWKYLGDRDDVPHEVKEVVAHLMFFRHPDHTTLDEAIEHVEGFPPDVKRE